MSVTRTGDPWLDSLPRSTSDVLLLSDRLVHSSGGRATATAIRGAELMLVPRMGHDLPRPLYGTFVDAVERTARRADGVSSVRA